MLHPHPKDRIPDPHTIRNRARLSVTADDLPATTDYVLRRVRRAEHPAWYLVVIRNGIEYDRLAHSYAKDPYMAWARHRIFAPLGVVDPAVDLEAYHRSRWWGLDWPLTARTLVTLEEAAAGYVTPWEHDWITSPA